MNRLRGGAQSAPAVMDTRKKGRHGLDDYLARCLPEVGVFFEAGANDGVLESNTYYLEVVKGWKGVLVEPVLRLAELCRRERPGAWVVNAALVGNGFAEKTIRLEDAHLMSTVAGILDAGREQEVRARAARIHGTKGEIVEVPARTMDSILEDCGVESLDFVSLDVEGYELHALDGFTLERWRPGFLLIECCQPGIREGVMERLGVLYVQEPDPTPRDCFFRRR